MTEIPDQWPMTPGGVTDWEAVFEDKETGFIPLIAHAHSPEALRDCASVLIRKLFTREEELFEVDKFNAELDGIISAGANHEETGEMRNAVVALLRRIKDERILIAIEHQDYVKGGKPGERRKPVAHKKPHHKPHGKPGRKAPAAARMPPWAGRLAFSGAIVALIALYFALTDPGDALPPSKLLVEEMTLAVKRGIAPPRHVYGGALRMRGAGGNISITAEGVPQKPCVNAAWHLVRTGRVAINGTMPKRISSAILAELCAGKKTGASLTWLPKKNTGE